MSYPSTLKFFEGFDVQNIIKIQMTVFFVWTILWYRNHIHKLRNCISTSLFSIAFFIVMI